MLIARASPLMLILYLHAQCDLLSNYFWQKNFVQILKSSGRHYSESEVLFLVFRMIMYIVQAITFVFPHSAAGR